MRAGFAGVGAMGAAMAGRALEDGLEVEVFDISPAATAALAERGASVASSPRELAERCDIVAVVVLSDDQVRSMCLDCVKASKKINKELEEGQIIQQGFLQVCELYGLHMQVQSTVVTKGGSPAGVRGK